MIELLQSFPPSFILILGALALPFLPSVARSIWALALTLLTIVAVWLMPHDTQGLHIHIASFDVNLLYVHPFTKIFATVFSLAAFAAVLFGLHAKPSEIMAGLIYAGGAIGVTFSGDYLSLFFYWELMAIGSMLVIFTSDQHGAKGAGIRYACLHFLGGVILMTGIAAHLILTGDASLTAFNPDLTLLFDSHKLDFHTLAVWLILIGVLINAAAPPFSGWLSDAYPKASPTGTVYLSAFTTKTTVFVLLLLFPGFDLLIYLGMFMVFYGVIYGILENDMRRILSYSLINQIGFMLVGIGIGSQLAQAGVALHAFSHIIYKALLFMATGSVLYMTGKSKCSDIGGAFFSMPLTRICLIVGLLAMSALPLTNSFITKSFIISSVKYEYLAWVWFGLIAASGGLFIHAATIIFPWRTFMKLPPADTPSDPPMAMQLAMVLLALLCIVPAIPSVTEQTLFSLLPYDVDYQAYTIGHIVSQIQIISFSTLAFFLLLPLLKRKNGVILDFDWFYRVLIRYLLFIIILPMKFPKRVFFIVSKKLTKGIIKGAAFIHGPQGVMARSWSIGVTATWTMILLGIYMLIYYA